MHKRLKQAQQGFTIVELMIVLAVGGLILVFIFLAVPTLTRNSRNGQRKDGVLTVLRAISRYELNNSASMPLACGAGGTSCFGTGSLLQGEKLIYYDGTSGSDVVVCVGSYGTGTLVYSGSGCAPGTAVTNTNVVSVYNYQRCDRDNPGASLSSGAGYSDVVALFAIEGSSGPISQCQTL
jgi:prepilin-type N-terminal cleavage/methylation domain-containing protein